VVPPLHKKGISDLIWGVFAMWLGLTIWSRRFIVEFKE
jgi:hypothetical protein